MSLLPHSSNLIAGIATATLFYLWLALRVPKMAGLPPWLRIGESILAPLGIVLLGQILGVLAPSLLFPW